MKVRRFESDEKLIAHIVDTLTTLLSTESAKPQGILLSGGRTPQPVYRQLSAMPVKSAASIRILFSDERMVPVISPENNFGHARPMIEAVGISEQQVLRVHTELTLAAAAHRYDQDIVQFLQQGGTVTWGLLGIGLDGHTASIFSREDVEAGHGHYAIAIPRQEGPSRVTVTADFLSRVDCLVFLASGADKTEIVKKLLACPESLPAGLAVAGAKDVRLWMSSIVL